MHSKLTNIRELIAKSIVSEDEDLYVLNLTPSVADIVLLENLFEKSVIEQITTNGAVLGIEEVTVGNKIKVELIPHGLEKFSHYHDFESFKNANEFAVPDEFYIRELEYMHGESPENPLIKSYFSVVKLIASLFPLSWFDSGESNIVYLMQDKRAVALPISYNTSLLELNSMDEKNLSQFLSELTGNIERKKIYMKELIDFLGQKDDQNQRFCYLVKFFDDFYKKCEAAYAFFLSDFSYSKLKLELEAAILDYSKNIRTIINDSQVKLIAIPAAFLVGSTQLDFENPFIIKNWLIVIVSFVFSTLIEIFIQNQESSVKIFAENTKNYKTSFRLKNQDIGAKEVQTLQTIISGSFKAIDDELAMQTSRLGIIRFINWGMSIFLLIVEIGISVTFLLQGFLLIPKFFLYLLS